MIRGIRRSLYAVTAAVAMMAGAGASAQEACTTYTVKEGESLASIAQAAYGSYDYQMIFNANRDVLGGNPNAVAPGTVLRLPCEDGSLPGAETAQAIIQREEARSAGRSIDGEYRPPIKFLGGDDWKPFMDKSLTGGGMLVRLSTTAVKRGGNDRDYIMSYVDDWGAHLTTLLEIGGFDIAIGWTPPPDCSKRDLLDEAALYRCDNLVFSLPIYESVTSYWSRKDSEYAGVRTWSDYAGARICRPEGWSTFDLTVEGLVEPVVSWVYLPTPKDCIRAAVDGKVDMVSLDLESALGAIAEIPGSEEVLEPNPNLSKVEPLNWVAHKKNPRAEEIIELLNAGLNEMRETGEWYAIIQDSLAEYNKIGG
ncbi:ABC-type amino acid transport substrate-binding protein [Albidovulum inexpectatum]|uniref:ABC-type amino acid transport substrate-binding protein n=1 Tax=Albidovulum inexpectatum TaxID=196587 RepID=A0A2S5JGD0_9RHOB|nr:transporter substrate-binding domain-containing protein [Albidovulum inexpectatum]PPB80566.1 ABC-type amino acid transport substrate-binding protein [Albidovulum inexpectatum]